tara:strand:- start:4334 stop:4543 length:210 start_codon:yes stop_codon:yes gene_type:complete
MNFTDEGIVFMRTETYEGQTLAYNAITGDFVCQGADLEELSLKFGQRFPNLKGILIQPDEQTVKRIHPV